MYESIFDKGEDEESALLFNSESGIIFLLDNLETE